MSELLCDNNSAKTHVNWSDFFEKLGFQDKISKKKQWYTLWYERVSRWYEKTLARKTRYSMGALAVCWDLWLVGWIPHHHVLCVLSSSKILWAAHFKLFNSLLGVWKCVQTCSFMFYILNAMSPIRHLHTIWHQYYGQFILSHWKQNYSVSSSRYLHNPNTRSCSFGICIKEAIYLKFL